MTYHTYHSYWVSKTQQTAKIYISGESILFSNKWFDLVKLYRLNPFGWLTMLFPYVLYRQCQYSLCARTPCRHYSSSLQVFNWTKTELSNNWPDLWEDDFTVDIPINVEQKKRPWLQLFSLSLNVTNPNIRKSDHSDVSTQYSLPQSQRISMSSLCIQYSST